MASTVNLQALGLNYSPNNLSLPEGSLVEADNVIIRRDNTIESRRGIKDYSNGINSDGQRAKQLIEYKNRILAHFNNKLYFDSQTLTNGLNDFYPFAGTYSETQDGLRIKSIEANKNLYFTTSEGIKKISARTADDFTTDSGFIKNAGAVKASDISASLSIYQGQKDGFLPQDSTVAYRTVWGYKDKNENLLLGTPSNRYVVYNYLVDGMAMDINTLCTKLDDIAQSTCLINDANYASSFYTPINTDTSTLKTTITSLAKKLDADILLANTSGTGAPLKINSFSMDGGGTTTIFFESGDPTSLISVNDIINIQDLKNLSDVTISSIVAGTSSTTINTSGHNLSVGNKIVITGTSTYLDDTWEVKTVSGTSFTIDKRSEVNISSVGIGSTPKITTIEPHGLKNGNSVVISGTTSTSVIISSISLSTNTPTITTSASHNLQTGDNVTISGSDTVPISITGTYTVTVTSSNTFTISIPSNLTSVTTNGTISSGSVNGTFVITSEDENSFTITLPNGYPIIATSGSVGIVDLSVTSGNISSSVDLKNINGKQTVTNVIYKNIDITGVTVGATTTINTGTVSHGFSVNDVVNISGISGISPSINGVQTITEVTDTTFKINVSTTGTATLTSAKAIKSIVNFIYKPTGTNTITAFTVVPVSSQSVKINSYNYTVLTETGDTLYATPLNDITPSIPGTSEQNRIINNTLLRIIDRLKIEKSGVIPTNLKTIYIDPVFLTDSANVKVEITIPTDVIANTEYFYQVYRTRTFTADGTQTLGTSGGNPVEADDEMRLVQEGFPTDSEFINKTITFIDQSPQSLVANNTNLYTNPETGVGILNANEPPPFAKDINRFKNVVFYSNTRTKQKLTSFQLLGLSNIKDSDKITIGISSGSQTYTFVSGSTEKTDFKIKSSTASNFKDKYFTINSANDKNSYAIWYRVNNQNIISAVDDGAAVVGRKIKITVSGNYTLSNGASVILSNLVNSTNNIDINGTYIVSDVTSNTFDITVTSLTSVVTINTTNASFIPVITNKTLKIVDILSTDESPQISRKTVNVLNTLPYEFVTGNVASIISGISLGSTPTITTSSDHNLQNGDKITISNSDAITTPTAGIDGTYVISGVTNNSFSITLIGKSVTTVGTAGNIISNKFIVTNKDEGKTTSATYGNFPDTSLIEFTVAQEGNGEYAQDNQVLLSSLTSAAQAIEQTAQSLVRVINKKDSIINAFYTSSETTPPGQMVFESKTLDENAFYVVGSNSGVGRSFNPDISPIKEVSGTNVIIGSGNVFTLKVPLNLNLQNSDKIIICGSNSNPVIDGIYAIENCVNDIGLGITTFTITFSSSYISNGSKFAYSELADTIVSNNEIKPNRIYYSKANEPEAVPLLNYFDISAEDKEILRIYPLRNSLFVFKEDGTYRISGEVAPFVTSLLDSSCVVVAPDSVYATNNIVYAWTSKGITPVSEAGASQEVSRPIDTEILRLSSAKFTNFKKITWGVGYDSDSSYTVYTNSNIDDEYATIGFRYCTLTNTWTNITRSQTCGIINLEEDKMYLGSGIDNIVNQERKNFDRTDYADKDFEIQLTSNSILTNNNIQTLIFDDITGINVGDVLVQNQTLSVFTYNSVLQQLDIIPSIVSAGSNNYYDTLKAKAGDNIRNKLVALATKLDLDSGVNYSDYYNRIANQTGNITSNSIANPTVLSYVSTGGTYPLITNRIITITGNSGSSPDINGTYQETFKTNTTFSIPISVTTGGTGGQFTTSPNLNNFDDIKACFNDVVSRLNSDSQINYNGFKQIEETTLTEAIVTKVDVNSNKVTINNALDWVVGPIIVYNAINCEFKYSPIIMGDALSTKQLFDTTIMLKNRAINKMVASFSSDLKPEFIDVTLYGDGNGIFGYYSNPGFGYGFFGGDSNTAPFRTLIPLQTQRCRYLNYKISHNTAREIFVVYGVSVTGNPSISFRGYR